MVRNLPLRCVCCLPGGNVGLLRIPDVRWFQLKGRKPPSGDVQANFEGQGPTRCGPLHEPQSRAGRLRKGEDAKTIPPIDINSFSLYIIIRSAGIRDFRQHCLRPRWHSQVLPAITPTISGPLQSATSGVLPSHLVASTLFNGRQLESGISLALEPATS